MRQHTVSGLCAILLLNKITGLQKHTQRKKKYTNAQPVVPPLCNGSRALQSALILITQCMSTSLSSEPDSFSRQFPSIDHVDQEV